MSSSIGQQFQLALAENVQAQASSSLSSFNQFEQSIFTQDSAQVADFPFTQETQFDSQDKETRSTGWSDPDHTMTDSSPFANFSKDLRSPSSLRQSQLIPSPSIFNQWDSRESLNKPRTSQRAAVYKAVVTKPLKDQVGSILCRDTCDWGGFRFGPRSFKPIQQDRVISAASALGSERAAGGEDEVDNEKSDNVRHILMY